MSMIGAALGSAISGAFQIGAEKMRFENEKKLAAQQNQYNLDMWKMQADYNSPQAQMQRFKAAGLNPYLVASQGNAGNMSSAPEMVTPSAPNYSKAADALGKAFNIEGLKTTIANRKEAQAKAKIAQVEALDKAFDYQGKLQFNNNFLYDVRTGRYIFNPIGGAENVSNKTAERWYLAKSMPATYMPYYKAQLISDQRRYLEPQIWMANYEKEHYPITYWIGTAGKGAKAISDVTGIFNPSRYLMPLSNKVRGYVTPTGRVLNY